LLALAGAATAAAEESDEWIRGMYTGGSPRALEVPAAHAWHQASTLAERTDGAFVLVGSGESMRPLYEPGTILVLRRIPYDELQRGQTVLYRNQRQKIVAHVLVALTRDGWRARGLNNPQHDMEPILEENCVGVVIAAYHPTDPATEMQLAGMP
jgi:signal peptidase I